MRETLYIRLHSAAPEAVTAFCIAKPDAVVSFAVNHAPLSDILPQAAGRKVVVLVSSSDVRLTSVTVPARQAAKVLQAAPYALEDQLAEDVDTLHFALGPRQLNGSYPVAVIAKAKIEEWLTPFRAAGLMPDVLVPETLCLPEAETDRWSALAEPGHITVRSAGFNGFGCVAEDLPLFLEMADPEKQAQLRILISRSFQGDFTQLGWPVELFPGFAEPMEALLQNYRPDHSINLLQGAYSPREDFKRIWQPWRIAAILAAIWIALTGLNHGVQAFKLKRQLNAQNQENVQRFQQLFPTETRIVDLSAQAEQQFTRLKGGGASGTLLPLIGTLSSALTATPGLLLQSLQYRDGALFVALTGTDLQQLETLRAWFTQHHGTTLEVQSANAGSDGVQIRIKLTPA
ncbi:type II secretion system protein GspL [Stenotrophobium rhamnosiphilum]|uniref:type II secretion system protein GspL n=1 Tax=Stenotrophobium rhamnosiphilum TaxID=2029166 RepID=UPI001374D4CD|nr:type II secretion system protein GspL [Stenotrophobium rhamnosiphilum]